MISAINCLDNCVPWKLKLIHSGIKKFNCDICNKSVSYTHLDVYKRQDSTNAEVVRGQTFEVGPRYTNLAYIGEGAYGMVV